MPVTKEELIKAIRWGEFFINNMYVPEEKPEVYNAGFMKGWSSFPVAVYDAEAGRAYPAGYGFEGGTEYVAPCASKIYTDYSDGMYWEGKVDLADDSFVVYEPRAGRMTYYYLRVHLKCKWMVEGDHVKAEITIDGYDGTKDKLHLFFNGIRLSNNVKADVGKTYTIRSMPCTGFPSLRFANRITMFPALFYYMCVSEHPEAGERASKIWNYLNYWGYSAYHYYAPMFGLSSDWPDDFWADPMLFHDLDTWSSEPVTASRYPYLSKVYLNRDLYQQCSVYSLFTGFPAWISMRITHLLNKYWNIDREEDTRFKFSAYGLYNSWSKTDCYGSVVGVPPLLDYFRPYEGVIHPDFPEAVMPLATACFLVASCLYEFGYYRGRYDGYFRHPDEAAEPLVKMQWGYPNLPNPTLYPAPITEVPEASTVEYGNIRRPDQLGGWSQFVVWEGGTPKHTYKKTWLESLADMFGMADESAITSYVGVEPTIQCVTALKIYYYYKYGGGMGKRLPTDLRHILPGVVWNYAVSPAVTVSVSK
jgi:hypothetical protein